MWTTWSIFQCTCPCIYLPAVLRVNIYLPVHKPVCQKRILVSVFVNVTPKCIFQWLCGSLQYIPEWLYIICAIALNNGNLMQQCYGNIFSKKDWLGVFVEHDGQELIDRQHPWEGISSHQLPGSLPWQSIAERPVGVVGLHQVVYAVHGPLRLLHLHALTPHVAAEEERQSVCWRGRPQVGANLFIRIFIRGN